MSLFISINLLFSFLIFIFSEDTDNKIIEPVIEEFQLLEKYKSIKFHKVLAFSNLTQVILKIMK